MTSPRPDGYFAHSGEKLDRSDWQSLEDHLEGTAAKAKALGARPKLPLLAETAARFHDFGKYDPAFQKRLQGDPKSVDHSTAGGSLLRDLGGTKHKTIAELLGYAILGHHAGLPDACGSEAGMESRIENFQKRDPISPEIMAKASVDFPPLLAELLPKLRKEKIGFDLSLAGRMIFSCLVDADFKDTEAYYDRLKLVQSDRLWSALPEILPDLRARFDAHMMRLAEKAAEQTDPESRKLNALRADILAHIRAQTPQNPGLFTLTVPTGGGKTLASMGFALDHAARHGHRRIIYAIPYTSIIDQTAAIFRQIFGEEEVLEHHSAIEVEDSGRKNPEDRRSRDKLRLAMEDWAAPIVVTTNVQLFESLFAARPSRCRKLHNIAGSVIVLDEAQCLPRNLLAPTLRMLEALAALYDCTILLCTATQPAFDSARLQEIGLPLAGQELAPYPEDLARRLKRARIAHGGVMEDEALIAALREAPQSMIIVNSRQHARELFKSARAEELEGLVHLTTRQYPAHRRRIIADLRQRLDYKAPQACRLIATSLIEAGVDLDFPKGWRAEAGLDSVVQAAGRVNREGRRPIEESLLTVFEAPGRPPPKEIVSLVAAMRSVAETYGYENLLTPDAIRSWFEKVYWRVGTERMGLEMAESFICGAAGTNFPYRRTAQDYRMIASEMAPVVILLEEEEKAVKAAAKLTVPQVPSGLIARELQLFTVQIPVKARALLLANGHASFHAADLRGDQFCLLDNRKLYDESIGLLWEDTEYLSADQNFI